VPLRTDRIAVTTPELEPEDAQRGQIVRDLAARHPRLLSPRRPAAALDARGEAYRNCSGI